MSNEFVRFGFISGEISPHLYGRSDLEKYDLGLALAYNWFIDYRGGITTRPGTEFGDYVKFFDKPCKLLSFVFAPNAPNTYVLLFGHFYVRFIQNNAYVLEDNVSVSGVTQASAGKVTAAAHGYANGDWVYHRNLGGMVELNGKLCVVSDRTGSTYKIKDVFGEYIDTSGFGAYTAGGHANRVYTVVSPYNSADLVNLRATQVRDTIRLTHRSYPVYDLIRNDHTDWDMQLAEFGNNVPAPTGVTASASEPVGSPPGASCAYSITAVDHDGNESVGSDYGYVIDAKDMTVVSATFRAEWDRQPDIQYFNVYRSSIRLVPGGSHVGRAAEVGYVGRAYGTEFFDTNIIPDFTRTPPQNSRPFADGKIKWINITASSNDFTNDSVVTITDPTGTGFAGFPIVELDFNGTAGRLVGVVVVDPGHGYTAPVLNVTVGTTFTAEIEVGELSGNNPRVSAVFQQRQVYGSTGNKPVTVWGSKPGKFANFDVSSIVKDDDSYEHEIDSSVVSPILHLVSLRGGLLTLTGSGIWILSGENGTALTPQNPLADPQSFTGSASVVPVRIGPDLLYIESRGFAARLLSYKDLNKVYSGEDISVLSSHFFTPTQKILNMAYAAAPAKITWCQRSDGSLLSFTILREQNIYAWAQHETRGQFTDVEAVNEGGIDSIYVTVDRTLGERSVKTFERFMPQNFEHVEDAWQVDCALNLPPTYPAADLQLTRRAGQNVVAIASASVFAPGDVGKVLRASGAKSIVLDYVSAVKVRVQIIRNASKLNPFQPDSPALARSGTWTLDPVVTSVRGLDHLNGEEVIGLSDGNVFTATVANGSITIPPASRVVVGLGYVCKAQTLPLNSGAEPIEGRRKRIVGVTVNQMQTRGLMAGTNPNHMYDVKERRNEVPGEPIELQDGTKYIALSQGQWRTDVSVYLQVNDPVPATVRAMVLDVEVGDAPH